MRASLHPGAGRLLALGQAFREAVLDALRVEGRRGADGVHAKAPSCRGDDSASAAHGADPIRPVVREGVRDTRRVGHSASTPGGGLIEARQNTHSGSGLRASRRDCAPARGVVGPTGFEPVTHGLRVHRSDQTELRAHREYSHSTTAKRGRRCGCPRSIHSAE